MSEREWKFVACAGCGEELLRHPDESPGKPVRCAKCWLRWNGRDPLPTPHEGR